jgi:hypothetical protein
VASYGVHLERREENLDEIASLQARYGSPVGVGGVLDQLNRQASRARVPGRGPTWGFTWNQQDNDSRGGGRRGSARPPTPPTPRTSRAGG